MKKDSGEVKRIAFGINSLTGGGAERVISVLASYFAEEGYECHLVCNKRLNDEYTLSERVIRHMIGINVNKMKPIATMQRIWRIRKLCIKHKIDIFVGFMGMAEYAVFATVGVRTKSVISIRNYPPFLFPTYLKKFYARALFNYSDGAVFQTVTAQEWFPKRLQRKSKIIFNPILEKFYQVNRAVISGQIVASGRLTAQKNYPLMIRAISNVAKECNIQLRIYGEGEDEEKLKSYAKEIGAADNIIFCGRTNDMPSVLQTADIYLMTSDVEGLPNALMEAMAVGIPCIATDSLGGGVRMLLGNNERGLLVRCGDEEGVTNAILTFFKDLKTKDELAKKAKEYATRFSVDNCYDDWKNYMIEVFSK